MNTLIIAFFAVLAVVAAAPPSIANEPIPIVKQVSDVHPDGSWVSEFETGDGIKQYQEGKIVGEGKEATPYVKGSYSYTDPEGVLKTINYVAGPEGYQATGDDVPETPSYIVRALEWNAAHPYVEKTAAKAF